MNAFIETISIASHISDDCFRLEKNPQEIETQVLLHFTIALMVLIE